MNAYPLTWPVGRPRATRRRDAVFGKTVRNGDSPWHSKARLTVADARARLSRELERLGARSVVLSTNVELRLDGQPRSGQAEPADPGAAVYFTLGGEPHCLACDAWTRVADNIAALAKHIEALRGMDRWGVGDLRQAFAGYRALPAVGETSGRPWWVVLGVEADAPLRDIERAFKARALEVHPDRPSGSRAAWDELGAALHQARAAKGSEG